MLLGMSIETFTLILVLISLVGASELSTSLNKGDVVAAFSIRVKMYKRMVSSSVPKSSQSYLTQSPGSSFRMLLASMYGRTQASLIGDRAR
jgi:hypothetical protein